MNEEISKMSLLICNLDVSTGTKEKLYTQNYKINNEIERLNNIINEIYMKANDTSITSLDLREYILKLKDSDKE